jgi:hypothetical protein
MVWLGSAIGVKLSYPQCRRVSGRNLMGTPLTPTGKSAWTLGESTLSFTSIAAIAPTKNDPTLFVVFHLYKAYNKADFDVALSRVERSKLPLDFVGVAIPTRASTDTFGCIYINTVAPTGP